MEVAEVTEGPRPWFPREKFRETVSLLQAMQAQAARDMDAERNLAEETNEYVHRCDNDQFGFSASVVATGVAQCRYLCRRWLVDREDWRRIAEEMCGSAEAAWTLRRTEEPRKIQTYLNGFYLGTDLGYEEMGEKWYLYFADANGSYFVPLDSLIEVVGSGW